MSPACTISGPACCIRTHHSKAVVSTKYSTHAQDFAFVQATYPTTAALPMHPTKVSLP